MYQFLVEVISENENAEFGTSKDGVSLEWIDKAEEYLGYELPSSYKWWLTNYGGGEVGDGIEIFSIYEEDFDSICGNDIVASAVANSKAMGLDPYFRLYVMQIGHHEAYFDIENGLKNSEYMVIEENDGSVIRHESFAYFLASIIEYHAG